MSTSRVNNSAKDFAKYHSENAKEEFSSVASQTAEVNEPFREKEGEALREKDADEDKSIPPSTSHETTHRN